MDVTPTAKTCPQCGSGDYAIRGRKKIAGADEMAVGEPCGAEEHPCAGGAG
jgi:hypothetical protein